MLDQVRKVFPILLLISTSISTYSQCPNPDFEYPSVEICSNQLFTFQNNSTGATDYLWDFCSGDLEYPVSGSVLLDDPMMGSSYNVEIAKVESEYIGFTFSRSSRHLFRLEFSNELYSEPQIVDLGDLGLNSNQILAIKLLKEGNNWHALISFFNSGDIGILSFGSDLRNTPTVSKILSTLSIGKATDLEVVRENGDVVALVADFQSSKLVRLEFGSSVLNDPLETDIGISGSSEISGVSLSDECDDWYALLTSQGNDKVFKVFFEGSVSSSTYTVEDITPQFTFTVGSPTGVSLLSEDAQLYSFVQSLDGELYKLSFGSSYANTAATENLGNLGHLTGNWGLSIFGDNSTFVGFSSENAGSKIIRVNFDTTCFASQRTSTLELPSVRFEDSTSKNVTLTTSGSNGHKTSLSKSVPLSSSIAPSIVIASSNQCLSNPIDFTHTSDQILVSFDWDFGDGIGTSTDPNPSYTYSSTGTYTVRLTVESENGCGQFIEEEVTIYNPPVASFTVPGGLLCSNNPIAFTNTSTFDPGSPTTWAWDFGDGSAISTEQAPTYSYPAPGDYTVKLTATLPTCTSEFTVPVSIEEGPLTDYSFENVCDGNEVIFTDLSSGTSPITSWSWDFGDGGNSSEQSPQHLYASPGDYQVTLTTTNQLGCSTFSTQMVTVHSNPVAAFENGDVCARAETVFTDNSTVDNANITSWEWDFGDGNTSTDQNPVHIFSSEGDYDVKLKVTTNFGCTDSLTVNTSVAPSATVAFSYDQACLGLPTQFINETTTDPSNPVTNTTWIIDGKVFTEQNPSYEFPQQGIYLVSLTVSTQNLCLVTYEEEISVNPEPTPTFGYTQSCGNGPVTFFDTTIAFEGDPIITRSWQIDGNVFANDSVVQVTPDSTGLYKVSLIITTENGCMVSTLENVNVLDAPQAGFATATSVGAYPFQLDFHNTSVAGENYAWMFDADTVQSTAENPTHTFTAEGDYQVLLVTSNALGCSDTTSQMISAVQPVYDAELQDINSVENDGKLQFFLNIANNGSIELNETNLEIRVQLGPDVAFTEPFDETLYAFQSTDYPLVFQLDTNHSVPFICAELVPIEYEAPATASCLNFSTKPIFSTPYPNPAIDWVTTGISIPAPAPIYFTWMDSNGKVFFDREISDTREGYNEISFEVTTYMAGSYFLNIRYLESSKTFKVVKR